MSSSDESNPPPDATVAVGRTVTVDMRKPGGRRKSFALPTLRVVAGPDMLKFASIYPGEVVVIGRDASCQLTLTEASVSRKHAVVEADGEGRMRLRDLGSTNGTTHNDVAVDGEGVEVRAGDELMVGGVTLRIEALGIHELAHLSKVLERLTLANKDALTGLVVRRWLDEDLPGLVARHQLSGVPLTAVFVDLDHFKRINDTWGHGIGDEVLRATARLLAMCVRDSDTAVRYGGEEFLVVLPNCDEQGAANMAERLRAEIAGHDWEHYAEELAVTASVGVAQHRDDEPVKQWLDRADKALYAAKRGGRDQVVVHSALASNDED